MKRSTKPRPPRHLVFDIETWKQLRAQFADGVRHFESKENLSEEDRRRMTIAKQSLAILRFLEADALSCTVERIAPASIVKRGPKQTWSDDMVLYAWHAIETRRIRARATDLKPFLEKLFSGLSRRGRRLVVHMNAWTGDRVEIENAGTARRLYARAKKLMAGDARLAARWRDLAQHHANRARN